MPKSKPKSKWWEDQDYLNRLLRRSKLRVHLGPEDALSIQVADMLRNETIRKNLNCVWFHVGNEGKRKPLNGAIQKAKGVVPGVYDFVFLADPCGVIELKVTGGLSDNQKAFQRWCEENKVRHAVCRSVDEVRAALLTWGMLWK